MFDSAGMGQRETNQCQSTPTFTAHVGLTALQREQLGTAGAGLVRRGVSWWDAFALGFQSLIAWLWIALTCVTSCYGSSVADQAQRRWSEACVSMK